MKTNQMKTNLLAILYGPSKVGKTLSVIRAFPDALFLAPRGAMHCASWLGWEQQVTSLETGGKIGIPQVTEVIKKKHTEYSAIVVDDLSILADQHIAACKKKHAGWSAFDVFNRDIYTLRDAARAASCHVIFTMHEQPPKEVKKDSGSPRWIPGAPLIPGWQLPEKLPAMADVVARVVHDDSATGWPYLYQVGPDASYITGDRLSIFPDRFPLNLREALIAAGYEVPRPEELAWMDDIVEPLAVGILKMLDGKKPDIKSYFQNQLPTLRERINEPRHIRWVIADALDRAQLRKHQSNLVDDFIHTLSA